MSMLWIQFLIWATLILLSGSLLAKYSDLLAERTGLGRAWIGLILLATVTSLPELATGISAITIVSAPDLAVGSVLGSCVFKNNRGRSTILYRDLPFALERDGAARSGIDWSKQEIHDIMT